MNIKCVECKRNIDKKEFDDAGICCDFCEKIYLCDKCGGGDNILYYYFEEKAWRWYANACKPCYVIENK